MEISDEYDMSSSVDMSPDERQNDFPKNCSTPVDFCGEVSKMNVMFIGPTGRFSYSYFDFDYEEHGKSTIKQVLASQSRCAKRTGHFISLNMHMPYTNLETHDFMSHVGLVPYVCNIIDMTGDPTLEILLKGMSAANFLILVISSGTEFEKATADGSLELLMKLAELFVPSTNFLILINKMDRGTTEINPQWNVNRYNAICHLIRGLTNWDGIQINFDETIWIPVSHLTGENINRRSENCPWYKGETLVAYLDQLAQRNLEDQNEIDDNPCRFSIQTFLPQEDPTIMEVTGKLLSGNMKLNNTYISLPSVVIVTVISMKSSGVELEKGRKGEILELRLRGKRIGLQVPDEYWMIEASKPGSIISDINKTCPLVTQIIARVSVQSAPLRVDHDGLWLQMNDISTQNFLISRMRSINGTPITEAMIGQRVTLYINFGELVPINEIAYHRGRLVLRTEETVRAIGVLVNIFL